MSRGDEKARARAAQDRRTGGGSDANDNGGGNGDVARYLERTINPLRDQVQRIGEDVAVLNGNRPKNLGSAALRRNDLSLLSQIPAKPRSEKTASGATEVTPDEFNALVDDVRAIYQRLVAISELLGRS